MSECAKPVVVVTGITGYLATEVAFQLVKLGYPVRGTVRSLQSDAAKDIQQLLPTVHLFEADLLKEGSFDQALEGAPVLLHTASPFITTVKDAQTELIDPAVLGTKNVLASAARKGIKNVVVTGSCAAVVEHYPTDDGSKIWTEDDWNTTSTLTDGPYRLSKVLAEKVAFEWAAQHPDVKLATILPTFIIGPPHTKRADATSIKAIRDVLNGTMRAGVPAASFGAIDIRDAALAHIRAFENPHAKGRYILSSEKGIPRIQMVEVLKKDFHDWPLPDKQIGEVVYKHGGLLPKGGYSHAKAEKELGIVFTPWEKSLLEMAHKLVELGIATK
jgi:nucleoside-diphosphate-sugar epimerase